MPVAGHKLFVSMFKLPTQQENPAGFHARFLIQKADGSEIDPNAEYFVLRLDRGGSDQHNVEACRRAIMTYAAAIEPVLPVLAMDLYARYGNKPGLPFAKYMNCVVHMLINIAGWYEYAALRELNNSLHWLGHYQDGRSPLEGYNYDLNESFHHA